MASCDWNEVEVVQQPRTLAALTRRFGRWLANQQKLAATRRQQRQDREAFLNLLGREEWVYHDMGISKADAEWASRLPLHINAARELEAIRRRNVQGR